MPRQKRKFSQSKIYHVMARGNEKKAIFLDDFDRSKFIFILEEKSKKDDFAIYSFCLMGNHYHLLIKEEGTKTISEIMKKINTKFAIYYNKKYDRAGHLFQDRFKSETVEDEQYLLAAVRYIHNNPVASGLVTKPSEYQWSSYNCYLGKGKYNFVQTEAVLSLFSKDKSKARLQFINFSSQPSKIRFADIDETGRKKIIFNDQEAKEWISEYLRKNNLSADLLNDRRNKGIRNNVIKELRNKSTLTQKQIADLLGVGTSIVFRAK